MSDKQEFIEAYFRSWEGKLDRAKSLIDLDDYAYEGVLVLLCYIGAFSAMRYPTLKDGEAFIKMLLKYSEMKDLYDQIDLLFFYQWPRSIFRDNVNYKELKNYDEIKSVLQSIYGKEEEIDYDRRYIKQDEIVTHIINSSIDSFDKYNFTEKLQRFSLAEIMYRYVRCGAVHNGTLSFINTATTDGEPEGYIITKDIAYETTLNIKNSLAEECIRLNKWPCEIDHAPLE